MVTPTPWFERHFHFDFPEGIFPAIFSRLEGSLFRLSAILQNADDEYSSYNNNGWSVKEHVGHLYDLEELWWKRLNDFLDNKTMLTEADLNNTKTKEEKDNTTVSKNKDEEHTKGPTIISPLPLKYTKVSIRPSHLKLSKKKITMR